MKKIFTLIVVILISFSCSMEKAKTIESKDGVQICFKKEGVNQPVLLFIHGWSNDKTIWNEQMSYFSEKYTVVSIDLPGFGESGHNRQKWTIGNYSDDVVSVVESLKLNNVVLVGFSMGAPVVIDAATKMLEEVIGIVVVDNLQNIEIKYPLAMVNSVDSLFMDLVTNPTKEKIVAGGFIKHNVDESYKKILEMLDTEDNPGKIGWSESFKLMFHWLNTSSRSTIEKVEAPIVAINSDNQPTNTEGFKKYNENFNAKIISNTGHVLMWDATDEFNRLLDESVQEFLAAEK